MRHWFQKAPKIENKNFYEGSLFGHLFHKVSSENILKCLQRFEVQGLMRADLIVKPNVRIKVLADLLLRGLFSVVESIAHMRKNFFSPQTSRE